ncbi:hypothetical protein PX699_27005 [Sphingobium sp. H39-3-25]|uniref:hypothetical protein n=1 Tax=Sphingobium arseniciresistens TaxID=3030834 RepID=UPI0023B8EB11|nr:hypothetical protein [Sphingobium arseniciresistens]
MNISRRDAIIASGLSFAALSATRADAAPQKNVKNNIDGPERYPPLALEDMYFEQRRVVELVTKRRDGGLAGPFIPLAYAPAILDHEQMLGEYCRFHTAIPPTLREWAIVLAARNVNSWVVFTSHSGLAQRAGAVRDEKRWGPRGPGISKEKIDAVAAKQRPANLSDDETLIYDFCMGLDATGGCSDEIFARAESRFGKAGVLDLVAIYGYYSTLGLVLNMTHTVLPNVVPPFSTPLD